MKRAILPVLVVLSASAGPAAARADPPPADAGFQAGGVIIQAGTRRLTGPDDLGLVLATPDEGAKLTLRVVPRRYVWRVVVALRGNPEVRH